MNSSDEQDKPGWIAATLRVLAKLGILRYGAKASTYTSGQDRPAEFQMPDVLDAERDLTTADDARAVLGAGKTRPEQDK